MSHRARHKINTNIGVRRTERDIYKKTNMALCCLAYVSRFWSNIQRYSATLALKQERVQKMVFHPTVACCQGQFVTNWNASEKSPTNPKYYKSKVKVTTCRKVKAKKYRSNLIFPVSLILCFFRVIVVYFFYLSAPPGVLLALTESFVYYLSGVWSPSLLCNQLRRI